MPYFKCKTKSGQILKILVDTGFNKNDIQSGLVPNPKRNDNHSYANFVGDKIKITHHTFLNLFNIEECKLKLLKSALSTFHAILGNEVHAILV